MEGQTVVRVRLAIGFGTQKPNKKIGFRCIVFKTEIPTCSSCQGPGFSQIERRVLSSCFRGPSPNELKVTFWWVNARSQDSRGQRASELSCDIMSFSMGFGRKISSCGIFAESRKTHEGRSRIFRRSSDVFFRPVFGDDSRTESHILVGQFAVSRPQVSVDPN